MAILAALWLLAASCGLFPPAPAARAAEAISFNDPLVDATDRGDADAVIDLLKAGHPADSRGKFEVTALMRAAYHGSRQISELLLNVGANPNAVDIGGATALHLAAREGHLAVVRLLLKYGAVVDISDAEGWTPLMRATSARQDKTVQALVEAGANVNSTNNRSETPLMLATQKRDVNIARYLLSSGADPEVRDGTGQSALDIARQRGAGYMENLLVSYVQLGSARPRPRNTAPQQKTLYATGIDKPGLFIEITEAGSKHPAATPPDQKFQMPAGGTPLLATGTPATAPATPAAPPVATPAAPTPIAAAPVGTPAATPVVAPVQMAQATPAPAAPAPVVTPAPPPVAAAAPAAPALPAAPNVVATAPAQPIPQVSVASLPPTSPPQAAAPPVPAAAPTATPVPAAAPPAAAPTAPVSEEVIHMEAQQLKTAPPAPAPVAPQAAPSPPAPPPSAASAAAPAAPPPVAAAPPNPGLPDSKEVASAMRKGVTLPSDLPQAALPLVPPDMETSPDPKTMTYPDEEDMADQLDEKTAPAAPPPAAPPKASAPPQGVTIVAPAPMPDETMRGKEEKAPPVITAETQQAAPPPPLPQKAPPAAKPPPAPAVPPKAAAPAAPPVTVVASAPSAPPPLPDETMRGNDERPPPVTTSEKQQVPPALVPETLKKPDVPEAQAAAPPPAPATSKAPEPAPQVALLMPKEVPPAPPKEVVPPPAPEQKPEKIPPPPVEKVTPPAPPQPVVLRDIPAPEKAPPPEKMTPPPAKPPELAAVPPPEAKPQPAPPSPAKVPAPAPLPSILEAKRPPPPPPAAPARKTAEVMETPAPATGPLPPLDMDEVPNMPAIKEVSPESLEVKGSASRPAPPFPTTPSPGPVPVLRPYSLVQDLPWQAELPSALPPEPGARPEEAPKPDSIDVAALPEMLPSAEGEAAMPEPPPATEAPAKAAEEPKTEAPPAATQPPAPARAKPEKSAEAVKKPEEEAKPAKPNDEAAIREKLAELERAAEKRRPATEIPTPSSEKELDDMPLPPVPPLSGDAAEEVAGLEIDQAKVPGELPAERGKPAKDNGKVEVAQAVRVPLSAPRDVEISSHAKAEDIPKTYAPRLFSPSRKNSGRGFWLQVGTFGSEDMAFRHFDDVISREGLSLRVRVIQHGKETYLRAGPFKTARDAADTCLSFLTDELTCSVVYEVTSSGPAYTQRPRHNGYDRGESTILPDYTYEGPRGRQIYWLQLGTYPSEQEVVEAWKTLSKDQAKTLKDMKLNIQLPRQSSAYERTYRMRAGPLPDQIEAAAKCRELKAANVPCIAVRGD